MMPAEERLQCYSASGMVPLFFISVRHFYSYGRRSVRASANHGLVGQCSSMFSYQKKLNIGVTELYRYQGIIQVKIN
jgi:hypothetical protein